ncbi:MAG: hypothetical protein QOG87_2356 [Actinomycetota bacterium]
MAALLLAVVPTRSAGQTSDAAGYDYFSTAALADGVTGRLVIDEFLAVEEFLSLSSVSAESRLESGRSSALAVLPDPGDLVLTLPGTAAGLAGIPGIPDYPAAVRADDPTVPKDELSLAPDAGLGALRLLAEADPEHALGRAFVTDLVDTVGVVPLTVGSIRSEASSRRIDPLTYEARATTTTNDIRLLGGLLRIDQLTTLVTARVEDGKVTASTDETRISGAEIAGQAVGIGKDGFTAPNQSQALQPVVDQLAAPLAQAGFKVTVTPGGVTQAAGQASADSGTLLIEYRTKLQDTYDTTLSLGMGRSTATVAAGRVVDEDTLGFPADAATDLSTGGSDLGGGDIGPAGVLGSNLESAGDVAAPPAGSTDAGGDVRPIVLAVDPMDFRGLYRLLAAAAAAMIAARFWVLAQTRRRPSAPRPNLRTMWRW